MKKIIAWVGSGYKEEKARVASLVTESDVSVEEFPDFNAFALKSGGNYSLYVIEGNNPDECLMVMKEARKKGKLMIIAHSGMSDDYKKKISNAGANAILDIPRAGSSFLVNLVSRAWD